VAAGRCQGLSDIQFTFLQAIFPPRDRQRDLRANSERALIRRWVVGIRSDRQIVADVCRIGRSRFSRRPALSRIGLAGSFGDRTWPHN
jgi:hypothetical protein